MGPGYARVQQLGTSSANPTCRRLVNRFVTTCLQICNKLCVFMSVVSHFYSALFGLSLRAGGPAAQAMFGLSVG